MTKTNQQTGNEAEVGFADPGLRLLFTCERDSPIGTLTVSASWHNRTYLSTQWTTDEHQIFLLGQQQKEQKKKKKKARKTQEQQAEEAAITKKAQQSQARDVRSEGRGNRAGGASIPTFFDTW